MARAWVLALLLTAAALTGCLSGTEDTPEPTIEPAANDTDASNPGSLDEDPGSDEDATMGPAASPTWTPGTWWRYRVEHSLADDPITVTLVVTDVSPQSYSLGWMELEAGLSTLNFHLPPAGELTRPDLASWWHGDEGRILDFPLSDGKTWTGTLGDTEIALEAERNGTFEDAPLFTIRGTTQEGTPVLRATYSPAIGFFTEIERFFSSGDAPSPGVYLEEHGGADAIDGTVYTPTLTDVLHTAQMGPDPEAGRPPIGEAAGRFSFASDAPTSYILLGAFLGGDEGVYEATWQPPEGGPVAALTTNDPGQEEVGFEQFLFEEPAGTWAYSLTAGGPGFVFAEAIGVGLEDATIAEIAG